jgi:drug/metabolite transporter (DMT)-like permease
MLALVTGCFVAGYSMVDGYGARVAGTPVGFYAWETILNAIVFAVIVAINSPGTLRTTICNHKKIMAVGGGASFAAYALVVWAFTQAPIAVVTALRETSIVFALLIGVFFLKERLSLVKLVSAMLTMLGALMLRFSK